jgi:hypothetical protein
MGVPTHWSLALTSYQRQSISINAQSGQPPANFPDTERHLLTLWNIITGFGLSTINCVISLQHKLAVSSARLLTQLTIIILLFSTSANAKLKIVGGECQPGLGPCDVMVIDGIRLLKKVGDEELKAFYIVYGSQEDSKPIEWRHETVVEWALCSEIRPIVMHFGSNESTGKTVFVGAEINHGSTPVMAMVTDTSIHNYVCGLPSSVPDRVDDAVVQQLLRSITGPFDVFSTLP